MIEPRGKSSGLSKASQDKKLSAEAHRQIVELLTLADKSPNPDIRAAAIEIAKDTSRNQLRQSAKFPPGVSMVAGTVVILGTATACWYALSKYSFGIATEI